MVKKQSYTNAIYVEFKPPDPKEMRGKLKGYIFKRGEVTSATMTPVDRIDKPDITVSYKSFDAFQMLISTKWKKTQVNFFSRLIPMCAPEILFGMFSFFE